MGYPGDEYLRIYSNDGSEELFYSAMTAGTNIGTVLENGVDSQSNGSSVYTYSGSKKFLGLATQPNLTTPTYGIGAQFNWNGVAWGETVFYIVEQSSDEGGAVIWQR